jgi:Cu+-exporting ATPase
MTNSGTIAEMKDPVCGMTVDPEEARARALTLVHEGKEYAFCGKGCMLDFRDDPDRFLKADDQPSM